LIKPASTWPRFTVNLPPCSAQSWAARFKTTSVSNFCISNYASMVVVMLMALNYQSATKDLP
jgi:hypothetical protein